MLRPVTAKNVESDKPDVENWKGINRCRSGVKTGGYECGARIHHRRA
jgi:hypothetical protein